MPVIKKKEKKEIIEEKKEIIEEKKDIKEEIENIFSQKFKKLLNMTISV